MFSFKNVVPGKTNRPETPQIGIIERGNKLFYPFFRRLMSISNNYITTNIENDRKWTSKLNARSLLIYIYFVMTTFRCLLMSVFLSFSNLSFLATSYFTYDPMASLFYQMGVLDRNLALLLLPVMPFLPYVDFLVSFTRRYRCYLYNYDLLVINREDFYLLNPQVDTWRKLFDLLSGKNCTTRQQNIKLKWRTLPHLGPLDHNIRVRSAALATVFDLLVGVATLLLAVLCPLVLCLLSLTTAWEGFSAIQKQLAAADISLVLYSLWRGFKISLFEAHCINTLLSVQLAQQRLLDRRLAAELLQQQQQQQHHQMLSAFFRSTAYLHRHHQLVDDMLTMDRQLISRTLFLGLISLFGFTIYSFSLFTLKSRLKSSIVFLISLLALVIILSGIRPLISATRLMHRPAAELLYRSVQCLSEIDGLPNKISGSQLVLLKVKLSTYYEVLTSGEKFAFSVGPLGKITPSSLFQVIFVCFLIKFLNFFYF